MPIPHRTHHSQVSYAQPALRSSGSEIDGLFPYVAFRSELYVYVKSQSRVHKERAMRQQRLRRYLAPLKALQRQRPRYGHPAHQTRRGASPAGASGEPDHAAITAGAG